MQATALSGVGAEASFARFLRTNKKVRTLGLRTRDLLAIAQSCPEGRQRLELASRHLVAEYGITVRRGDRTSDVLDWESLPASVLLDRVFGIDFAVTLFGHTVFVDITTNPGAVGSKLDKLVAMENIWLQLEEATAIEIDCIGVLLMEQASRQSPLDALKRLVKQKRRFAACTAD